MDIPESLLKQEIMELTELLRNAPEWTEQRRFLEDSGLLPNDLLLIEFRESEEGVESGTVLVKGEQVLRWQCDEAHSQRVIWSDITLNAEQLRDVLTLPVAINLWRTRKGDIGDPPT